MLSIAVSGQRHLSGNPCILDAFVVCLGICQSFSGVLLSAFLAWGGGGHLGIGLLASWLSEGAIKNSKRHQNTNKRQEVRKLDENAKKGMKGMKIELMSYRTNEGN